MHARCTVHARSRCGWRCRALMSAGGGGRCRRRALVGAGERWWRWAMPKLGAGAGGRCWAVASARGVIISAAPPGSPASVATR
eukprot:350197-Chlamydomonas_euryale.AAC.2